MNFTFSLSISRLWKLAFIYTNSTKKSKDEKCDVRGFFFKLEKKKNLVGLVMVRISLAVIFHQMLVLTEGTVVHSELFLPEGIKKRKKEKRIFYCSEQKYTITDLSHFCHLRDRLWWLKPIASGLIWNQSHFFSPLLFYFRINICFACDVSICVSSCVCEICMAVCLWIHIGM